MRILIIRHGEPDYVKDSLTPKGFEEVELLAKRMAILKPKDIYVSPLGRARATVRPTEDLLDKKARVLDWLKEFDVRIVKPNESMAGCAWDWLPTDWQSHPAFFTYDHWYDDPYLKPYGIKTKVEYIYSCFDGLLSRYGYVYDKGIYRVKEGHDTTIALFCHFGLEMLLLSRILQVSPMILWHGFCAAPSSVTSLYSEERQKGIASFRINQFGDTSHLFKAGEPDSTMARFCEVFGKSSPNEHID